ncbi:unnamed protein product [Ectocarpus sp. 6 AP-2014]
MDKRVRVAAVLAGLVGVAMAQSGVGSSSGDMNENAASAGEGDPPQVGFWTAFANSVIMIIATEIGDKTFFIAAIMAMSHPRLAVFGGAVGALAVMTVLSAALGYALPAILPKTYTHYASALLFLYFGFRMLKEGMESHGGPSEELTEVEEELAKKREGEAKKSGPAAFDMEGGGAIGGAGGGGLRAAGGRRASTAAKSLMQARLSEAAVITMSFSMTFLAEWGDRSQIATIALATNKDPFGVTAGGVVGHSLCTGMAVIGGKLLAARISEKTVHLVGGALFLVFALHALVFGE